jgi:hypothetical protein
MVLAEPPTVDWLQGGGMVAVSPRSPIDRSRTAVRDEQPSLRLPHAALPAFPAPSPVCNFDPSVLAAAALLFSVVIINLRFFDDGLLRTLSGVMPQAFETDQSRMAPSVRK